MAFMYDYLTESELAIERDSKMIEMEGLRLINAMEAVAMRHELNLKTIEVKTICESCDDAELVNMYRREYNIFTEGVRDIWEKFKQLVRNIVNKILGRKTDDSAVLQSADEVELDDDPNFVLKLLNSARDTAKGALSLKKLNEDGESEWNVKKIAIIGGTVTGIGGLVTALTTDYKGVRTKIKAKLLPQAKKQLEDAVQGIQDIVDKSNPDPSSAASGNSKDNSKDQKNDGKDGEKTKSKGGLLTKIQSLIQAALNLGKRVIEKIKDAIDSVVSKITGGKKSSDNNDDNSSDESGKPEEKSSGESDKNDAKDDEKPADKKDNDSNGTPKNNKPVKKYSGKIHGMIAFARDNGFTGISSETADKLKQNRNVRLSASDMQTIYTAAKNAGVDSATLQSWKDKALKLGSGSVKLEFVNGEYIEGNDIDSIFESMDFSDILDDDDTSLFESTDTSVIDDISDILDTFF